MVDIVTCLILDSGRVGEANTYPCYLFISAFDFLSQFAPFAVFLAVFMHTSFLVCVPHLRFPPFVFSFSLHPPLMFSAPAFILYRCSCLALVGSWVILHAETVRFLIAFTVLFHTTSSTGAMLQTLAASRFPRPFASIILLLPLGPVIVSCSPSHSFPLPLIWLLCSPPIFVQFTLFATSSSPRLPSSSSFPYRVFV